MGCQPQVSGRIDLDRNTAGAAQATLLLVQGDVLQKLSDAAQAYDAEAMREAARQLLPELAREIEERELRLAELRQRKAARDSVEEYDDCIPAAEREIAVAKREYVERIAEIAPRMAAFGLDAGEPRLAVDALEAGLVDRLSSEAGRLRSDYLRENVVWHSEVVFTQRVGTPDRLCWSIENVGHLTLLSAELRLLHDGEEVPPEVARMVWGLPPKRGRHSFLTRDGNGEQVRGLPAGQKFERCLYATAMIPPDEKTEVLASHGISRYRPSRRGDWAIRLDAFELTNAAARRASDSSGGWEFERRPIHQVFESELEGYRTGVEEAQLIHQLSTSPSAQRLHTAEQRLLSCHLTVELQREIAARHRTKQAIEGGATDQPGLAHRLRPIAAAYKRLPERIEASVRKAKALVNANRLATQIASPGDSYTFESVLPGEYTLGGILPAAGGTGMIWLIPIRVEGSVEQDLGKANARAGSLSKVLEEILLGPRA